MIGDSFRETPLEDSSKIEVIKIGESFEDLTKFGQSKMSLPVPVNLASPAVR